MPRIPYLPEDLAEPGGLVEAIRARRGGALTPLDRMLLWSPPYAAGWNALLRAVRQELALDAKLRELAIVVVAVLNGAAYEREAHAPELLRAGGTAAQLAALENPAAAIASDLFDPAERAVIRLTLAMTRGVAVDDAIFADVRAALGEDRLVVELVGVIATYNMVSRFLVALGVGE